jgi:hypothetical protein
MRVLTGLAGAGLECGVTPSSIRRARRPPLVGEVDVGHLDALAGDVAPDVELGPVREREDADVLARRVPAVVEVPQLGPLLLGVPLAEGVAEAEEALLRAGLLLVAARPAEDGVVPPLLDGAQQRGRLQRVAQAARHLAHATGVDVVLHLRDDQARAELGGAAVAEGEDLVEVVTGVHVHQRETGCGPARTPWWPGAASRSSPCRR